MFRRTLHTSSVARSYIGSQPIAIPPNVTLSTPPMPLPPFEHLQKSSILLIQGPLGDLPVVIPPYVRFAWSSRGRGSKYLSTDPSVGWHKLPKLEGISYSRAVESAKEVGENPELCIKVAQPDNKDMKKMWGTVRSLISNAVLGTSRGFHIQIRLVGVGYKVALEDHPLKIGEQRLRFKLGFSHDVLVEIPSDLRVVPSSATTIEVSGIDKQRIGEFARDVQKHRKPEPYKGKGIFIGNETIKRKTANKKK